MKKHKASTCSAEKITFSNTGTLSVRATVKHNYSVVSWQEGAGRKGWGVGGSSSKAQASGQEPYFQDDYSSDLASTPDSQDRTEAKTEAAAQIIKAPPGPGLKHLLLSSALFTRSAAFKGIHHQTVNTD